MESEVIACQIMNAINFMAHNIDSIEASIASQ